MNFLNWPKVRKFCFKHFICFLELDRGEIVMHPNYSLSEAVSAIELMDPKMDSGMERPDLTLGLKNALEVSNFTLSKFKHCLERKTKTEIVCHGAIGHS